MTAEEPTRDEWRQRAERAERAAAKARYNALIDVRGSYERKIHKLLDRLRVADDERLEHARINGMGSEREARLMAERDTARKDSRINQAKFEAAQRALEKAGAGLSAGHWIPCAERMPPTPGDLEYGDAYMTYPHYAVLHWLAHMWIDGWDDETGNPIRRQELVTHWMPLPDPPEASPRAGMRGTTDE